jgi:hypothetical protein
MPTMLPMPKRVAAIKRAIESELDFSVLARGGEDAVADYYRSIGMNGRAKICEWQRTGLAAKWRQQAPAARPARTEARLDDLDFWGDDDDAPIDDDVPDDQPVCSACKGSGRDAAGNECQICGGTGKIPAEDQPDDDDESEDDE